MLSKKTLSEVRGFYYAGSWGTSGLDLWQHFNRDLMATEIARGKRYFPGWNVARWFLSPDAYFRDHHRFLDNFEAGIQIFASHGITLMPTLFNRWRDPVCDFGGVSLEHIVPGLGKCRPDYFTAADPEPFNPWDVHVLFRDYIQTVVKAHATDDRIIAWDVCNEPLLGPYAQDPQSPVRAAELKWLGWCADETRRAGATQPLTIGCNPSAANIRATEPFVDFISFHPYYIPNPHPVVRLAVDTPEGFVAFLDEIVAFAAEKGKELLANETVWGANDDEKRVEILRITLSELKKRKLGFMAVGLHHSLTADLHSEQFGPVGWAGRLEFINADGNLRPGHEAFNEY